MDAILKQPLILLFDSTCGLCDATVQFILKRDSAGRFRFASLQSQTGRDLMTQHGLDPDQMNSVVIIDGDQVYTKSGAVLRSVMELPEPWPLIGAAVFIPANLRDDAYDFVARHRHQWFKNPDACRTPTEQERERFLV